MKETAKKQKTLYIVLLIATIAAVILAVTLSLVFSLSGSKPDDGDIQGPGIEQPGDIEGPGGDIEGPGGDVEGPGGDVEGPGGDVEGPGEEVDGPLVVSYEMPVSGHQPGMQFSITQLVWSNTLRWYVTHNGTDFLAAKNTPVKAVYDGKVTSIGYDGSNGYNIKILQDDGIVATYKSLTADIKVENGDTVKSGTIIGAVGDSMSSEQNEGYHLHLEMTSGGEKNFIDPMSKLALDDK